MQISVFTIDAFTCQSFCGNLTAVCLLEDVSLKKIILKAIKMLLPMLYLNWGSCFGLGWFTPTNEVPICGDATLGTQEKLRELLNLISCLVSVASSAEQVTTQSQNRKRAPAWSERETLYLIAVWGEESMQAELRCSRRNADIYAKIAQGMMDRGYTRDTQQCCVKIKELRQAYQKTKEANVHSGLEPQTCRFYDQLHAILREEPTATPPLSVDTCKGGASRNTDEDFVEEEEEENAQQASGESVFPVSQDLFITLEPIPSQGELFPDLKTEKAPLVSAHF
uniref:Myb/SANT-like DNA-binding domain-containing protein n=1 Tax=Chrysemys picta bellii TaxID=8478 RepID=A0A8C3I3D3_CHRPI